VYRLSQHLKEIPLLERGEYYRGLLVLIRKDGKITPGEREAMVRLGQGLDFDKVFCETTLDELMRNPNIKRRPVKFLDKSTAELFLRDAALLALADGNLHPKEVSWLRTVAEVNELRAEWLNEELRKLHQVAAESSAP
jgi:hypothetical protein